MSDFHAFDHDQQAKNWEMLNEYEDRKAAEAAIIRTKVALEEREARVQERERELNLGCQELVSRQEDYDKNVETSSVSTLDRPNSICPPIKCLTEFAEINGKTITPSLYFNIAQTCYHSSVNERIEFNNLTGQWRLYDVSGKYSKTISNLKIESMIIVCCCDKPIAVNAVIMSDNKLGNYLIPISDFQSGKATRCMPFLSKYPGINKELQNRIFYEAVRHCSCKMFFNIPEYCGWNTVGGSRCFVSDESIFPEFKDYYPLSVKNRILTPHIKDIRECADQVKIVCDGNDTTKKMLVVNIGSTVLSLFEAHGLHLDRLFIVEFKDENFKNKAIAFLKNQLYTSLVISDLTETPSSIKKAIHNAKDGTVIFHDSPLNSNSRRSEAMGILSKEVKQHNGNEKAFPKAIVILTANAGALPTNVPGYFIAGENNYGNYAPETIQKSLGEFTYAFLKRLSNNPNETDDMVSNAINQACNILDQSMDFTECGTDIILTATAYMLKYFDIFNDSDIDMFVKWIKNSAEEPPDSDSTIANEFASVLSEMLVSNELILTNQFESPYYKPKANFAMIDASGSINLDVRALGLIQEKMLSTHQKSSLLEALERKHYLNGNKGYKRDLRYISHDGIQLTASFYSVSSEILNKQAQKFIVSLKFRKFFRSKFVLPEGLIPMVCDSSEKIAGVKFSVDSDENLHTYVSGSSRSGKTYYLIQQALFRAKAGNQVIILDQTGAFTKKELLKHTSESNVEKFFEIWDIESQGLPIDITDFSECQNKSQAKNKIYSVLASAAKISGENQKEFLKSAVSKMFNKWKNGDNKSILDILDYVDAANDVHCNLLLKLESALEPFLDISENKKIGWDNFLKDRKKILIISTGSDAVHKPTALIDLLIADFYSFKTQNQNFACSLIVDEVQDLYLVKDGPIDTILRKGGKHRLSMLIASQEFSNESDSLGKIIGNCDTLIFFRPKGNNIKNIAKITGHSLSELSSLEKGECIVFGKIFDFEKSRNSSQIIIGKAATFDDTPESKIASFYLS